MQEALYKKYASKMMGVCMRYAYSNFEAEDIFQDAFVKVFQKLDSFRGEGSFEGWMRFIFVNTAINYYNKNKKHNQTEDVEQHYEIQEQSADVLSKISMDEILEMVQRLSDGYRLVFNLHVIEGYSHKEIGEMLNITEGTSKSQLSKAKLLLRNMITEKTKSKPYVAR